MTAKDLYRGVLIELNKVNAPNILLELFNYFANKAINNYVNKRYNIYDVNQQTTDDLRVLKSSATLIPHHVVDKYEGLTTIKDHLATYETILPSDYLHILNCICIYKVNKTIGCYNKDTTYRFSATRLTADMYSLVLDNFWNKPDYYRPYYYIHNVNLSSNNPTNPYTDSEVDSTELASKVLSSPDTSHVLYDNQDNEVGGYQISYAWTDNENNAVLKTTTYYSLDENENLVKNYDYQILYVSDNGYKGTDSQVSGEDYGKDAHGNDIVQGTGLPKSITIGGRKVSNVERGASLRYGNTSLVRLEIRYGSDNRVFELVKVIVDYIKAPLNIRLTQEEIDSTEDYSLMLEYPDYVCQEIINELVHLIMENISDLRLQTHPVVSLSIANPAQALTQQAQGLSAQ